jgi:hypothetical protein
MRQRLRWDGKLHGNIMRSVNVDVPGSRPQGNHPSLRILVCVVAPTLAGLCLAGYLRFATVYSALYGLSAEAARVASVRRWGLACLWSLSILEVISVLAVSGLIRLHYTDLPPLMKVLVRYGIAVFLSAGGTWLVLLALYECACNFG